MLADSHNPLSNTADATHRPPRVSVLMPVYNAGKYLNDAITCIRQQTFTDFELICINDGSTDDSLTQLQRHAKEDARISVLDRPNTGICGALNDGLRVARGELIARMDADDFCDPTRLVQQVAFLDARPNVVAVGTWVTRTDPTGIAAGVEKPPTDHADIDEQLLQGNGSAVVHATMLIHRDVLNNIAGWCEAHDGVEDLDLLLRLAEVGELANLPKPLYRYRRHLASTCSRRYEELVQRIAGILQQAYRRRGLDRTFDMTPLKHRLSESWSHGEYYRVWACHALHQQHTMQALRHAWAALRHEPFTAASWRVLAWTLSANVPGKIALKRTS